MNTNTQLRLEELLIETMRKYDEAREMLDLRTRQNFDLLAKNGEQREDLRSSRVTIDRQRQRINELNAVREIRGLRELEEYAIRATNPVVYRAFCKIIELFGDRIENAGELHACLHDNAEIPNHPRCRCTIGGLRPLDVIVDERMPEDVIAFVGPDSWRCSLCGAAHAGGPADSIA